MQLFKRMKQQNAPDQAMRPAYSMDTLDEWRVKKREGWSSLQDSLVWVHHTKRSICFEAQEEDTTAFDRGAFYNYADNANKKANVTYRLDALSAGGV